MARIKTVGLNLKQAAAYCGVSTRTVRTWVEKGLLRCVRTGRKGVRFHQDTLDDFLKGRPAA